MKRSYFALFSTLLLLAGCSVGKEITVGTLLTEMLSPESLCEYPEPSFTTFQASSYDRKSIIPGTPGWFANSDGSGFIRTDTICGRVEKVLLDEKGPGAITRIWITTINPQGTMRFYFDGDTGPDLTVPAYDLAEFGIPGLGGLLQTHTSYEKGVRGGSTLFLPIPYAKGCKVTFEEPDGAVGIPRYFQINVRRYKERTAVETFSDKAINKLSGQIEKCGKNIAEPVKTKGKTIQTGNSVSPRDSLTILLPSGGNAIKSLTLEASAINSEEYGQTMRKIIVSICFDGVRTVYVPLSDFSGGGMGAPSVQSRYLVSDGKGKVTCYYLMPYASSSTISLINLSDSALRLSIEAKVSRYQRTENTLYFHSSWRDECGIAVNKAPERCREWTFAKMEGGRGIYVGDVLSLFNHTKAWYGEGDEKIYVDGESFPSHFGTGTEDYYNSSWAPVKVFQTPFGGAPRADLPSSSGYNTFNRFRSLDIIPFNKSFDFEIEMMSWVDGSVDYSATTFWYGDLKTAAGNCTNMHEACRTLPETPANPVDFKISGSIEFEETEYSDKSENLKTDNQSMLGFPEGKWSGGRQTTCYGGKPGDFIIFKFTGLENKPYKLSLQATKAPDYGTVSFEVNGKETASFDSYSGDVVNSGPVPVGSFNPENGVITLKTTITGKNDKSTGYMFGLDCITFDNPATVVYTGGRKCLLLPIEDNAPEADITFAGNDIPIQARLARTKTDYFCPLYLDGKDSILVNESPFNAKCLSEMQAADKYTPAYDKYRPVIHFAPAYGWTNDPNGLVYADGEWHLFFQHNPYGAKWGNMTWGHAVSHDLHEWKQLDNVIAPDSLGAIFSGSCVIDVNNTAGFGKNAMIAIYTSAGRRQSQCIAYSTDNGRTFTKYDSNPVLESEMPDFRDPKVFFYKPTEKWIMALAVGKGVNFYSSDNLKEWTFESRFSQIGENAGDVIECPDLIRLPSEDGYKWVLICSSNKDGGIGSTSHYYIGTFDGHEFISESDGLTPMDYGRDNYAAITWGNAPDGRNVLIGWMDNWLYADETPTFGRRGSMTIPRELSLHRFGNRTILCQQPVREIETAGQTKLDFNDSLKLTESYMIDFTLSDQYSSTVVIKLSNSKGEEVVFKYDLCKRIVSLDRSHSGNIGFNNGFPCITQASLPDYEKPAFKIIVDRSSVECFTASGSVVMTDLVFPSEPYCIISIVADRDNPIIDNFTIRNIK